MNETGKICTSCGEWKTFEEFHMQRGGFGGRNSVCKLCKRWKDSTDPTRRIKAQTRRYGITIEMYDTLLAEQGNCCPICGVDFSTLQPKRIHLDHCHSTNKIRGILCSSCNISLGGFKDSIPTLSNAIDYLEKGMV